MSDPEIIDRDRVRVSQPSVEFADGDTSSLVKTDEGEFVTLLRLRFGDFESLEGIRNTLVVWVEDRVVEKVDESDMLWWDRIVRVALSKKRPALAKDFPYVEF